MGQGVDCRRGTRQLWRVIEVYILTCVMVIWVYTFVRAHQTVHFILNRYILFCVNHTSRKYIFKYFLKYFKNYTLNFTFLSPFTYEENWGPKLAHTHTAGGARILNQV